MAGAFPGHAVSSCIADAHVTNDRTDADIKPWGRFATLALGLFALLAGQFAGLAVLTWYYGQSLRSLPNLSGDGVAVTLIIFVATVVQVTLLALFVQMRGGDVAQYLGLKLPRRAD